MPKVLVIGSANVDFTVKLERLPAQGETVSSGDFYTAFGGKGANQALAALRAGADVRFLAKVGDDQDGEALLRHLNDLGLAPKDVLRDGEHHTGIALIMVDRQGRNAIGVAPGSNRYLTEKDIRDAESLIAWGNVVLTQLEVPIPSVTEALRLAKDYDLLTILNPAPARPLRPEVLPLVDILTPNEVEASALSGISVEGPEDASIAGKKLIEAGAGQVIVTLGEKGCCWVHDDAAHAYPSIFVDPVDSTAAGDAFSGALACALAEGKPLERAIPFANAAGALSVTKKGAHSSLPTRAEIERMLSLRSHQ